ncbi:amidohydrolase family protein [Bifidobacterium sp. SMB2]|uniref:Amidohydrolase family protein n=1 Tax=Bifidobacterium saimiriisciurei TaxID=2661627 RepID=A0ABX0CCH6_9BIFI|nr:MULTISPECIES: dihydroorotase [Bifidobacterium]NEG96925.1 amidohydrolase family protein [Bifidobacterium sp. SMB2]NEH11545.1 amidohydrolase family protein [Bifidobacterium saimiriisciurei]
MLTLRNITVWNTGETIDLVIPEADEKRFFRDEDAVFDGEFDATGLTLAPGFADPHVHFRDPGQTYKESMVSGAAAAASGGYTDVLIMPNTVPALDGVTITDSTKPGAEEVLGKGFDNVIDFLQHYDSAHDVSLPVRYDLCVCASKDRAGYEATDLDDWRWYIRGVAEGEKDSAQLAHPITAISDDGSAVTPEILDDVLRMAKESGLYLIEHCEHHDTGAVNDGPVSRKLGVPGIPEDTELKIVARDIEKARETGVHIHFQHVSTAISFDAIRKAKAEGLPITCETAPHYLALSDEALLEYGTLAKMNPPLRSEADRQATIEAIADGTVDLLATDHAPHTLEEKERGFLEAPNGIIGLECAYGVCHKVLVDGGHISDHRLIELMSTEPQRLMGHEPADIDAMLGETGTDEGRRTLDLSAVEHPETADFVVLDTGAEWKVDPERFHSQARNTPFGGWDVTGRPLATIIGSKLVFSRL